MNYFIVVRNDKESPYSNDKLKDTKTELWSNASDKSESEPRKHGEVYEAIQKGDLMLCYSGKDKSICAILEAGDKINEGVILKFKDSLNVSLDTIKDGQIYQQILALSPDKYSPFTQDKSNIFYGTYFKSTKKQFWYICALTQN